MVPEPQFARRQVRPPSLRGLIEFGPYSKTWVFRSRSRGAACSQGQLQLDSILNELTRPATPREAKITLSIPASSPYSGRPSSALAIGCVSKWRAILTNWPRPAIGPELARQLFDAIGRTNIHRTDFDVLLIYLPNAWEACFESPGFDLHDYLKSLLRTDAHPFRSFWRARCCATAAQT
jgi:hypothetical protein